MPLTERQRLLTERIKRLKTSSQENVTEDDVKPIEEVLLVQEPVEVKEENHSIEIDLAPIKDEPVDEDGGCPLSMQVKTEPWDFPPMTTSTINEEAEIILPDYFHPEEIETHDICPVCFAPPTNGDLRHHLEIVHPGCLTNPESLFKCLQCHLKFKIKDIYTHQFSTHCLERHNCSYCDAKCLDWVKLRNHLYVEHRVYCCSICDVISGTKSQITAHIKSILHQSKVMGTENLHEKKALENFCPLCPIDSKPKIDNLRIHISVFHVEQLKNSHNTCQLCKNQFKSSMLSIQDIDAHISSTACLGRRTCYYCDKQYNNWLHLQSHLTRAHDVYCCQNCDIICGSKKSFESHVASGMHLYNLGSVDKRQLVHSKNCPICPLGTAVRHLQFHLRLVHPNVLKNPEQAHQCVICKQIITSKDLLKHDETCLGVKALEEKSSQKRVCKDCNSVFIDADELELHSLGSICHLPLRTT